MMEPPPLLSLCAKLPLLDLTSLVLSDFDYRPVGPDSFHISRRVYIPDLQLCKTTRYLQRSPTETPFPHLRPAVVRVRIDT